MNKTKKRDYGRENAHRYARICIKESGCIPIDIFKSKIIDNEDNKDNVKVFSEKTNSEGSLGTSNIGCDLIKNLLNNTW